LAAGLSEYTLPEESISRQRKYRLTTKGQAHLNSQE